MAPPSFEHDLVLGFVQGSTRRRTTEPRMFFYTKDVQLPAASCPMPTDRSQAASDPFWVDRFCEISSAFNSYRTSARTM